MDGWGGLFGWLGMWVREEGDDRGFCNGFDEPGLHQPFTTGSPREGHAAPRTMQGSNAVVHSRIN